jgi:hypothetical protein
MTFTSMAGVLSSPVKSADREQLVFSKKRKYMIELYNNAQEMHVHTEHYFARRGKQLTTISMLATRLLGGIFRVALIRRHSILIWAWNMGYARKNKSLWLHHLGGTSTRLLWGQKFVCSLFSNGSILFGQSYHISPEEDERLLAERFIAWLGPKQSTTFNQGIEVSVGHLQDCCGFFASHFCATSLRNWSITRIAYHSSSP